MRYPLRVTLLRKGMHTMQYTLCTRCGCFRRCVRVHTMCVSVGGTLRVHATHTHSLCFRRCACCCRHVLPPLGHTGMGAYTECHRYPLRSSGCAAYWLHTMQKMLRTECAMHRCVCSCGWWCPPEERIPDVHTRCVCTRAVVATHAGCVCCCTRCVLRYALFRCALRCCCCW